MVGEHDATDRPLTVEDAARAVIGLAAPRELRRFSELSAAYFRDPVRSMGLRGARSEPTGFPGAGGTELITGVVLGVLTNVLTDAVKSGETRLARAVRGWLKPRRDARKVRRAGPGALEQPAVTTPAAASEAVARAATLAGLDPRQQKILAAAFAAVLPAEPGAATAPAGTAGDAGEEAS